MQSREYCAASRHRPLTGVCYGRWLLSNHGLWILSVWNNICEMKVTHRMQLANHTRIFCKQTLLTCIVAGMNGCPLRPGSTPMTSIKSSWCSTSLHTSTQVPGLSARPALQPNDRIRERDLATSSVASGWIVMYEAPAYTKRFRLQLKHTCAQHRCKSIPALAKSAIILSTGITIKCTSMSCKEG